MSIKKKVVDHKTWMALNNVIDIVQAAQTNHLSVPVAERWNKHSLQGAIICSDWLYKMQNIRSRF